MLTMEGHTAPTAPTAGGLGRVPAPAPAHAPAHSPAPGTAPQQPGIFLAGFMDCAEEALRYLTTMECLPENHPIIQGLHEHLRLKQQHMLAETNDNSVYEPQTGTHHQHHEGQDRCQGDNNNQPIGVALETSGFSDAAFASESDSSAALTSTTDDSSLLDQSVWDQHSDPDASINEIPMDTSAEGPSGSIPIMSTPCRSHHGATTPLTLPLPVTSTPSPSYCMPSTTTTTTLTPHPPPFVIPGSLPRHPPATPGEPGRQRVAGCHRDVSVAQEALDLATLARNNPAIACLTQELFDLFDEEEDEEEAEAELESEAKIEAESAELADAEEDRITEHRQLRSRTRAGNMNNTKTGDVTEYGIHENGSRGNQSMQSRAYATNTRL